MSTSRRAAKQSKKSSKAKNNLFVYLSEIIEWMSFFCARSEKDCWEEVCRQKTRELEIPLSELSRKWIEQEIFCCPVCSFLIFNPNVLSSRHTRTIPLMKLKERRNGLNENCDRLLAASWNEVFDNWSWWRWWLWDAEMNGRKGCLSFFHLFYASHLHVNIFAFLTDLNCTVSPEFCRLIQSTNFPHFCFAQRERRRCKTNRIKEGTKIAQRKHHHRCSLLCSLAFNLNKKKDEEK